MSELPTLYLVDGSSYIYRAYFAVRHLSGPGGHPTNAIYGFIQMMIKLLKDYRPEHLDVILMDLIMPVMGGIEAFHELRKISGTVPIIICSGYGVESVGNVIGNDPHAGFVHKPYKPDELRDVVVRMMG